MQLGASVDEQIETQVTYDWVTLPDGTRRRVMKKRTVTRVQGYVPPCPPTIIRGNWGKANVTAELLKKYNSG